MRLRLRHDSRGIASNLIGLVAITFAFSLCALLTDLAFLYSRYEAVKRGLDASNMAVFQAVDQNRLADGVVWIDPVDGADAFRTFLCRNLRLDDALRPLPGSPVSGPVEIEDFRIFNPEDLPARDPLGHQVTNVSVYTQIRAPVQPLFVGFFHGPVYLRVALLTDIAPSQ